MAPSDDFLIDTLLHFTRQAQSKHTSRSRKLFFIQGGTATREMGDGLNYAYLPGGRWEMASILPISQAGDGRWLALSEGGRREIAS